MQDINIKYFSLKMFFSQCNVVTSISFNVTFDFIARNITRFQIYAQFGGEPRTLDGLPKARPQNMGLVEEVYWVMCQWEETSYQSWNTN